MGGSGDDDFGVSVAADLTGGVVVGGYFQSDSITIGSTSHINSGNEDAFLARCVHALCLCPCSEGSGEGSGDCT